MPDVELQRFKLSKNNMSNKRTDADYTTSAVDKAGRKSNMSMFMVMLGFTFFSASMWVGQELADGLNFTDFLWALLLGGLILAAYTGSLGYIGAESGLSLDMLARRSFGEKGSWLPSAMISFTQIGWFGVGLAMFAIPVAKEFLHLDVTPDVMPWQGYLLVAIAGILMTASAYFGIKSLTLISYIAVPAVAILGTVAMIMAVNRGDAGLVEQFAKGTKDLGVIFYDLDWYIESRMRKSVAQIFAERGERQKRKLEALSSIGYADYGNTPQQPRYEP